MITIGMPSYNNPTEVWATLSALKLYQNLTDVELLVVDNANNQEVQKIAKSMDARCEVYTEKQGTGPAKNAVFDFAAGDFVLCMDSHVMLWPESVERLRIWFNTHTDKSANLIHGPMAYDSLKRFSWEWIPKWRGNMWGIWDKARKWVPQAVMQIQAAAMGLFGCRKDSWLRFPDGHKGFGGQACVIHEKYRKAGRTSLLLPWLKWVHNFHRERVPYQVHQCDIINNYLAGFEELGLDPEPIYEHFGREKVEGIKNGMSK